MESKHTTFKVGVRVAKAYHSLDNLYRIENSGVNLNQIYFDVMSEAVNGKTYAISFSECQKILNAALEADLEDLKDRSSFIREYLDHNRVKASTEVLSFVIEALKMPEDDTVSEGKKIVASTV